MSEVRELTAKGKVNVQIDRTAKTTKDIIKENVFTYFNLIFLIISLLLILAGAFNSLTFLPVIIANTLIGIFQELHAKKVLDGLSILHEPNAIAIRDGSRTKVPIDKLVLGDVIVLRAGNQIPADAEIVSGEAAINEALLTGEADEIVKGPGDELMSGSFVASGECMARLTRVGQDSYISKLMLKARKMPTGEQSEMVRSINRIVIAAGIMIIPIGVTLFELLSNISSVFAVLARFIGFFKPVIMGVVIAYIVSPLAKLFFYRVFRRMKRRNLRWYLSVFLSFALLMMAFFLLIGMLMPQLIRSIVTFSQNFDSYTCY